MELESLLSTSASLVITQNVSKQLKVCDRNLKKRSYMYFYLAVCQQDGKWNFANLAKCREGCRLSDAPEIHNARLVGSGNRHLSSKGRDKFYDINGEFHQKTLFELTIKF